MFRVKLLCAGTSDLGSGFSQPRPTFGDVRAMAQRIGLTPVTLPEKPFSHFLHRLRESRTLNGGAQIAAFDVPPDSIFRFLKFASLQSNFRMRT